jgi:hypothetical protein
MTFIDRKLTSIVSRLAQLVRLVITFALPIGYLVIAYNDFSKLEFKAMVKATALSSLIAQFPQGHHKILQVLQEWTSFPSDIGRLHPGSRTFTLPGRLSDGKRFLLQRPIRNIKNRIKKKLTTHIDPRILQDYK